MYIDMDLNLVEESNEKKAGNYTSATFSLICLCSSVSVASTLSLASRCSVTSLSLSSTTDPVTADDDEPCSPNELIFRSSASFKVKR